MKSTMYLHNRVTNEDVPAEIIEIPVNNLKKIMKSAQFGFNWLKEIHNPIYGLRLGAQLASLPLNSRKLISKYL